MLFNPGTIVATPGAMELADQGINLTAYLQRHLSGDWGDLCPEDIAENDFSLTNGYRLLSVVQHCLRKALDHQRSRSQRDYIPYSRRILKKG